MMQLFRTIVVVSVSLLALTGCPGGTLPQTRDEFVKVYKPGGAFRNTEHYTVNRSVQAVVNDVSLYAERCVGRRVLSMKIRNQVRGTTTYHPKMATTRDGAKTLSVQKTFDDRNAAGAPPGGMFSLVAEFRAAGSGKTKIDVYHAGEDAIAKWLKLWAEGDKTRCPYLGDAP